MIDITVDGELLIAEPVRSLNLDHFLKELKQSSEKLRSR